LHVTTEGKSHLSVFSLYRVPGGQFLKAAMPPAAHW
jgi:hypothetical protein